MTSNAFAWFVDPVLEGLVSLPDNAPDAERPLVYLTRAWPCREDDGTDIYVARDHIGLLEPPAPLPERDGFTPMNDPYDAELRALALDAGSRTGQTTREAVLAWITAPHLLTSAERTALVHCGAEAAIPGTPRTVIDARSAGTSVLSIGFVDPTPSRVRPLVEALAQPRTPEA